MITGQINSSREAVVSLQIVDARNRTHAIDAVIDTGFNAYLTLPSDLIDRLDLLFLGNRRATLGDGRTALLEVYLTTVL